MDVGDPVPTVAMRFSLARPRKILSGMSQKRDGLLTHRLYLKFECC
jgi:hypothetical protein